MKRSAQWSAITSLFCVPIYLYYFFRVARFPNNTILNGKLSNLFSNLIVVIEWKMCCFAVYIDLLYTFYIGLPLSSIHPLPLILSSRAFDDIPETRCKISGITLFSS